MPELDAGAILAAAEAQDSEGFRQGMEDAAMLVNVARSLGAERRRQGMPIADAAAELRTSVRTLEDLESGAREATAATLVRYGRILGGRVRVTFTPLFTLEVRRG